MIRIVAQFTNLNSAMILFSSIGLTFIACPPIKEMVSFSFSFFYDWEKFIPRLIPVLKLWRVAENHSQSDKSRSSASILVQYPKFDTSRHLRISVCVFLKNLSSLKKNPWRNLRNYLACISTRATSAPICLRLPFWRHSYFTRREAVAPLPPGHHATALCS